MKYLLAILILSLTSSLCFAKVEWEEFRDPVGEIHIARTAVPHGWLVLYRMYASDRSLTPSGSLVYVPDENHKWTIKP